jgi:hypothetical protein
MSIELESVLIVHVNPVSGRDLNLDDWYTNIHIRDVMRIDGAIAAHRFIISDVVMPSVLTNQGVQHQAHTIFEWDDAKKSVDGHFERAGTPAMPHTRDCNYGDEVGGYFRPVVLSNGWTRAEGFGNAGHLFSLLLLNPRESDDEFVEWFRDGHAPAVLKLPGFDNARLFVVHEASTRQALPKGFPYTFYVAYGVTDRQAALSAWADHQGSHDPVDIVERTTIGQAGCWEPRTVRVLRETVLNSSPESTAEEQRARRLLVDHQCEQDEMDRLLRTGTAPVVGVRNAP